MTDTNTDADFSCVIDGATKYGQAEDFTTANLGNATSITLLKNFTAPQKASTTSVNRNSSDNSSNAPATHPTPALTISGTCVLDLNGKTLTVESEIGIKVAKDAAFTLKDSKDGGTTGTINHIWNPDSATTRAYGVYYDDSSKIKCNRCYAAVNVGDVFVQGDTPSDTNATFNMEGGTITAKSAGICVSDKGTVNIKSADCSITSTQSSAVFFGHAGNGGGSLTMDAGTISSTGGARPAIQVSGNITTTATEINIKGGTVNFSGSSTDTNSSESAIVAAGRTNLTISGNAKITSDQAGIEFRAGTLNMSGGTIEANTTVPFSFTNKSGASGSGGVGINVCQHSTKKDIDVNITGGSISGYVALAVINAANNGASDGTIAVDVENATLTSTGTDAFDFTYGSSKYTVKGKNAVVALDTRVTVNISKTKVIGNLTASQRTNVGEDDGDVAAYGTLTNNTYNVFEDNVTTNDLFNAASKTANGVQLDLKAATKWNATGTNQFIYYTKSGDTGTGIATIAASTAEGKTKSDLLLTTSGTATTLDVDFNKTLFTNTDNLANAFNKLDASAASFPLNITGNDKITAITGGTDNDSIKPGADDATLTGGAGNDMFFFDGNKNTITDFGTGTDSITLANASFRPANADFVAEDDNITLDFGGGDALMFEGLADKEVPLQGHIFATRYHAFDKQIALTAVQTNAFDASTTKFADYETIDAAAAGAIKITGNSQDNRIIGSNKGGTLNGGSGNDKLYVTDRESGDTVKYLFEHTTGKDLIEGFDDTKDTLAITPDNNTEAKGSGSKLTLTMGKDNSVTLKSDVDIEKVNLKDDG